MEGDLVTREQALRILQDGYRALVECFDALPDGVAERPRSIGDGEWSAKDLLGHITTWEEVALDLIEDWRAGRPPRIDELAQGPAWIDRFNAEQVERKKSLSRAAVRSQAEAVHQALVSTTETLSDEEWAARVECSRGRLRLGEDLGSVLGAPGRPFGHVGAHLPDLLRLRDTYAARGGSRTGPDSR